MQTKIINYEKNDTINKRRKKYIASKRFAIYARKDLVLIMMMTIKNTIK